MRQLKGGKQKESRREKKERRDENKKIHQQLTTVVLPVLGGIFLLVCLYVYIKSRPIYDD